MADLATTGHVRSYGGGLGNEEEIWVMRSDGTEARRLALGTWPSWSPDSNYVFYHSKIAKALCKIAAHDRGAQPQHLLENHNNMWHSVSPDGRQVAMILSMNGLSPDLYVASSDGTGLKRLTSTPTDDSSPCWSPDGRWICFATKIGARRTLAKVPAGGGDLQRISTSGVANPSEPVWSPDGKWIAFTAQMGGFEICVIPAGGGEAVVLVSGEDPSWAPNSRTLVFARRAGGKRSLSLLDVFTKQSKDVPRISGSNSQPAWAQ